MGIGDLGYEGTSGCPSSTSKGVDDVHVPLMCRGEFGAIVYRDMRMFCAQLQTRHEHGTTHTGADRG